MHFFIFLPYTIFTNTTERKYYSIIFVPNITLSFTFSSSTLTTFSTVTVRKYYSLIFVPNIVLFYKIQYIPYFQKIQPTHQSFTISSCTLTSFSTVMARKYYCYFFSKRYVVLQTTIHNLVPNNPTNTSIHITLPFKLHFFTTLFP